MKSIRLSLVLYFLVLLAGALGAVSWLVYESTSRTLRKRELRMQELVHAQYQASCHEKRTALDQRVLGQAQTLASMARTTHHLESLLPLGMLGAATMPQGQYLVPLWLAEGTNIKMMTDLRSPEVHLKSAEDLIPEPPDGKPQEYYEVFRSQGQSLARSKSLADQHFLLDEDFQKNAPAEVPHFDDVDLGTGPKVRRVTLKFHVKRERGAQIALHWLLQPKRTFFKGPSPRPGSNPPRFGLGNYEFSPALFVQYARDSALLGADLQSLGKQRDEQLAALEDETLADLANLRQKLWWISLATFLGILTGSLLLIHLGLAPLARLSDAVSRVSPRDFRLKLDTKNLPRELLPIADRLGQTLEQLKQAFAREKQATADISHELRTPLAALLTTVEVALRKQRTPEQYREMLEDCQYSGQQMMQLVERLMALARLDSGADRLQTGPVDVADLARKCANLVRPLAEARGVTIALHADKPVRVQADSVKICEVLNNLLHNAIQYNKPNGSIDLSVHRENGHVLLEVSDTGIGISAEARGHIFERFYRADPSRHSDTPNAGLGLSIVKSYIDLMGGKIDVDSSSAGSTFRVQVPAVEPSPEPIMQTGIRAAV